MKRRRHLSPVSEKRLVLLGERVDMVNELRDAAEFNQDRTTCAAAALVPDVACEGPIDPHEPLSRGRGGSITDRDNVIFVCRRHHSWIHWHPTAAHLLGLLVHSWERA